MTKQKSSKLKYSLVTIFSIFLLYSFSKNSNNSLKEIQNSIQINQSKNKIRSLLDKDKVDKVCERASKEVQEFFSEEKENEEKDYEKDSESVKQLMNIIDGKGDEPKNESIKKYIFRVLPVAFFIVFGVISIILWPTCICCMCCCKCCCCICCCKSCMKLFQLIIFFVSGGAFAVTFIFSTYGIAATDSVFKGVDSTLCTIFKVINEAVEGQSKTTLPKWAGIEGVKNILSGIAETIDDSQDEIDNTFSTAMITVEQSEGNWNDKMTDAKVISFTPFSLSSSDPLTPTPKTKDNPTGKDYTKVIPDYALNYDTYLNSIQTEFRGVTDAIFTSLRNAKNDIDSAFKDASFKSSLDDASNSITELQGSFDDLSEKIAKPLLNNEELISKQIKQYAQIVFGIIMGLCAGMTGIYVIQYINCCSPLQFLLTIVTFVVWNLLFLFSIVSFIVSGFIGLIGIVGKDGTALANYLISEENLESQEPRILGSGDSNQYLKVCIHGDGNLKEQLKIGDSMDQLDDLYNLQNEINTHKTTLNSHSTSVVIQQFNEKNYEKNFLDCKYFNEDAPTTQYNFIEWLDELNFYTQKSTNSYQDSQYYDERWDKVTSYTGYTYSSSNTENAAENSKKLLSIYDDWTGSQVYNRYNGHPVSTLSGTPYNSVADGAKTLYYALKTVLKPKVNACCYQKIDEQNTILKGQFEQTTSAMKTALNSASIIITRLTTLLSDYIGEEGSIYSLINCAFIGKDFNFLMKQLHDSLGNNVYNFATVMITMTCFLTLALYASVLFSVARKKSQESSEK
jgi:hypothetical protein